MLFSQIAHEQGDFSVEDVYAGITRKIVGRHPHVFGDDIVKTDADLSVVWAREKAREASESGKRGGKDVDGEPFSMPALTRAARVLKEHPLEGGDVPDLLRIVNELIQQGKDPDAVLREQLRTHVLQVGPPTSGQE
jgi:tetrapyrrole methylase family protein/MazG family protein